MVFPRRPSKTLVSASAANAWRTCWIAWNGVRWTPRSCNRSWCWTHAWSNGPWCNVTLGLQWVGPHYIKGVLLFMFLCVVFCMYIHMSICVYIYMYICVCLCTYVYLSMCFVTTIVVKWPVQIVVSQKSCLGPLLGSLEVVHGLIPIDTVFMCNIWVLTLSMYIYTHTYIHIVILE